MPDIHLLLGALVVAAMGLDSFMTADKRQHDLPALSVHHQIKTVI